MCGDLVGTLFPRDKKIAGVIIREAKGHMFYPADKGDVDVARSMSKNLALSGARIVTVYSGLPDQLRKALRGLNGIEGLPGFNPQKEAHPNPPKGSARFLFF
jgi:hypothetical protein